MTGRNLRVLGENRLYKNKVSKLKTRFCFRFSSHRLPDWTDLIKPVLHLFIITSQCTWYLNVTSTKLDTFSNCDMSTNSWHQIRWYVDCFKRTFSKIVLKIVLKIIKLKTGLSSNFQDYCNFRWYYCIYDLLIPFGVANGQLVTNRKFLIILRIRINLS